MDSTQSSLVSSSFQQDFSKKRRRIEDGARKLDSQECRRLNDRVYPSTSVEQRRDNMDMPILHGGESLDVLLQSQEDLANIMTHFDQVDGTTAYEFDGGWKFFDDDPAEDSTQDTFNTRQKRKLDELMLAPATCSDDGVEPSVPYSLAHPVEQERGTLGIDLNLPETAKLPKAGNFEAPAEELPEFELHDELISFGMIRDIPVKLLDSKKPRAGMLISASLLGLQTVIDNVDALPFALLPLESSKILLELQTEVNAELQFCCEIMQHTRSVRTRIDNSQETRIKFSASLHVVVYGPLRLFEAVGDFLQERGVYLQDPSFGDKATKYKNPHRLCQIMEDTRPALSKSQSGTEVELLETQSDPFSSLEGDVTLPESLESPMIATPLYSHQKQALTFMLRRERGWAFDAPYDDIWKTMTLRSGRMVYTNTITGDQQFYSPPNFRGGILADAMGLGKSLSIIALIASGVSTSTRQEPPDEFYKGTLLVVPKTLLSTWEAQLRRHLRKDTLSWLRYHGKSRRFDRLALCDIVITTYQTIASEWRRPKHKTPTIFSKSWHRIVLDEAHLIRGSSTNMSHAVCSLRASHRWAVTGTPIQNRLTDLASLFRFLKIYPFDNPRLFDEHITKPWKAGSRDAISKLIAILRFIALRRHKSVITLPDRNDEVHFVSFRQDERRCYDALKASATKVLDTAIQSEKRDSKLYLNALQLINSLRLMCNLGSTYLAGTKVLDNSVWDKKTAQVAYESMESAGTAACVECSLDLGATQLGIVDPTDGHASLPRLFRCLQLLCGDCFLLVDEETGLKASKSTCGCPVTCDVPESVELPSKVEQLLKELRSNEGDEKSVVFSFWTSTLDLVSRALKDVIPYQRLDGRMSEKERATAVHDFNTDTKVKVLLLSISCGAVGLDLTAATHVYLMEPQWNPMIEDQALDRVHRIGQTKPVTTIRFIVKDSFEEKIRAVQTRKRHLADISMSQSILSSGLSQNKLELYRSLVT